MIGAWLTCVARADVPDAPLVSEPPREEESFRPAEEVVVYDLELESARHALIEALRAEGFTIEKDRGEYLLLRHVTPWHGEVRVYDEGWILVRRQPVRVEAPALPFAEKNSPIAWAGCILYAPVCVRPGGQLVGGRKFRAYESEVAFVVDPEVRSLADRIAAVATEDRVNELPGRLSRLWIDGAPLVEGAATLVTWEERRRAIWTYWNERTDTEWGEAVRLAVESFVRAEIQRGPNPFTVAELTAWEVERTAPRPFAVSPP